MKTAAEYRAMAEECFKWAREAHSAEVRVSLLKLAQVWLDIASKLDGLTPHRKRRGFLGRDQSKVVRTLHGQPR
jgi:hypothetical protein